MSWPCINSPTHHHKFHDIHFINPQRTAFVRGCKYCDVVQAGQIVITNGVMQEIKVPLKLVNLKEGLENSISKDVIPKDIDKDSGEISKNNGNDVA